MAKFKGRDLRIKVRTSTGPDVFMSVSLLAVKILVQNLTLESSWTISLIDNDFRLLVVLGGGLRLTLRL